jgi:hypothetical protein
MDISTRDRLNLLQDDQTWVGRGGVPRSACKDIVLDRSAFDLVTDFPNGYLPSGLVLGKVTATGLYAPYDNTVLTGVELALGLLFTAVPYDRDSTADLGAALFWDGEVIEDNLPAPWAVPNTAVETAAKADLVPGGFAGALITFI